MRNIYLTVRAVCLIFKIRQPRRSSLGECRLADASCCGSTRPSGLVISELSWKTRAGRRKKDSRVNSSFGVAALVSLLFSTIICHDSFRCSSSPPPSSPIRPSLSHPAHSRRMQLESRCEAERQAALARSLTLRSRFLAGRRFVAQLVQHECNECIARIIMRRVPNETPRLCE